MGGYSFKVSCPVLSCPVHALNANIYLSAMQPVNINQLVDSYKEKYVQEALKVSGGNKTKAAKMLGLKSHQVFTKWMADLNIIAP